MGRAERIALGLRTHSGWAVMIALQGPVSDPVVVDRRRLELCDQSFPRQPYHAAESLAAAKAEALVSHSLETAGRLARAAVAAALESRRSDGHHIAGAGLLLSSSRPLPKELARVLASHALIHTAEGEMYRDVLRSGCEEAGVPVSGWRERDIVTAAGPRLKLAPEAIEARLAALGKPLGPPWQAAHRLAAAAALSIPAHPA